jgi:hypothetical protein
LKRFIAAILAVILMSGCLATAGVQAAGSISNFRVSDRIGGPMVSNFPTGTSVVYAVFDYQDAQNMQIQIRVYDLQGNRLHEISQTYNGAGTASIAIDHGVAFPDTTQWSYYVTSIYIYDGSQFLIVDSQTWTVGGGQALTVTPTILATPTATLVPPSATPTPTLTPIAAATATPIPVATATPVPTTAPGATSTPTGVAPTALPGASPTATIRPGVTPTQTPLIAPGSPTPRVPGVTPSPTTVTPGATRLPTPTLIATSATPGVERTIVPRPTRPVTPVQHPNEGTSPLVYVLIGVIPLLLLGGLAWVLLRLRSMR